MKLYSVKTQVHDTQVSNFGHIVPPDFTNATMKTQKKKRK